MRSETELAKKNVEISFEFSRFVLNNPEMDRKIPDDAVVIFDVANDPELTAYNRRLAKRQKGSNQSFVVVHIKGLAPSRLLEPTLSKS